VGHKTNRRLRYKFSFITHIKL